jgi:uncharacterized protein YndB with AHSA1/START domain
MAPIVSTVEIERTPSEVFSYATDPSRFGEWQGSVVSGSSEGVIGVGSKFTTTRKIGGAQRASTSEITEYEPPRRWAVRGVDGPIRADVSVVVEPIDSGARSRVTFQLNFVGHGLGKLIAPVVTSQARKEVPVSCQNLKQRLEAAT